MIMPSAISMTTTGTLTRGMSAAIIGASTIAPIMTSKLTAPLSIIAAPSVAAPLVQLLTVALITKGCASAAARALKCRAVILAKSTAVDSDVVRAGGLCSAYSLALQCQGGPASTAYVFSSFYSGQ